MSVKVEPQPKGLKIGSILTLLAGLFLFTIGSIVYVLYFYSVAHPNDPWLAGRIGPAPYTLNQIRSWSSALADDFEVATHTELTNVINSGFLITVITIFGLRRQQKWAWYTLLAVFLWVGTNDVVAMLRVHAPPIPIIPETTGLLGLLLARSSIFNRRPPDPASQAEEIS